MSTLQKYRNFVWLKNLCQKLKWETSYLSYIIIIGIIQQRFVSLISLLNDFGFAITRLLLRQNTSLVQVSKIEKAKIFPYFTHEANVRFSEIIYLLNTFQIIVYRWSIV